jgi:hypothetical protein
MAVGTEHLLSLLRRTIRHLSVGRVRRAAVEKPFIELVLVTAHIELSLVAKSLELVMFESLERLQRSGTATDSPA